LLNDVGEYGGFPCGDAVLGKEDEEFGKGGLHVDGGIELGEVAEERGSEIEGVGIVGAEGGMFLAEGGGVGSYGETALVTVEVAEGTAGGVLFARKAFVCGGLCGGGRSGLRGRKFLVDDWANGFGIHFGPLLN
jgi:hypothetical protein